MGGVSLAAGLVTGFATDSEAYWMRTHESVCSKNSSYSGWQCPIVSTSDWPHYSIDSIRVYFVAGTSGSYERSSATACVAFHNAAGGACGTVGYTGTLAPNEAAYVSPGLSAVQNTAYSMGFPYVTYSANSDHVMKGIYVHIP